MTTTARGTFEVTIRPAVAELEGAVARFEMTKTFEGDLQGTGAGIMLSAGDPHTGEAGYVAIETVRGELGGLVGGFVLQQCARMHAGSHDLDYQVVPGSGHGQLAGIVGTIHLQVSADGTHRYELVYEGATNAAGA